MLYSTFYLAGSSRSRFIPLVSPILFNDLKDKCVPEVVLSDGLGSHCSCLDMIDDERIYNGNVHQVINDSLPITHCLSEDVVVREKSIRFNYASHEFVVHLNDERTENFLACCSRCC